MKLVNSDKASFYNIDYASDFIKVLADHLKNNVTNTDLIVLPTYRACRALEKEGVKAKIVTYADLKDDSISIVSKEELRIIVMAALKRHSKSISQYEDVFRFVTRFYTFCESVEVLKSANSLLYKILAEVEKMLLESGKVLPQIASLKGFQKLASKSRVTAVISNNSALYIDSFIKEISKRHDATIIFQGLDRNLNWSEEFKPTHQFHIYQKLINECGINIDSIKELGMEESKLEKLAYTEYDDEFEEAEGICLKIKSFVELNPKGKVGVISNNPEKNFLLTELLKRDGIIVNNTSESSLIDSDQIKVFLEIINVAKAQSIKNVLNLLKQKAFRFYDDGIYKVEAARLRVGVVNDEIQELLPEEFRAALNNISKAIGFTEIAKQHFETFESFFLFKEFEPYKQLKDSIINFSFNIHCNIDEYYNHLRAIICGFRYRESEVNFSNVEITNLLESNLMSYDFVLLTEFNTNNYPAVQQVKRFLSKEQETKLGISSIEEDEGKSLASIVALMYSKKVGISYAKKSKGAPVEKSYIIEKIKDFIAIEPKLKRDNLELKSLKRPIVSYSKKPKRVSVTGIERLMEDPYAYYAHYILGLKPLERLDLEFSNREFGIAIHDVLKNVEYNEDQQIFCNQFIEQFKNRVDKYKLENLEIVWLDKVKSIASAFYSFESSRVGEVGKKFKEISGFLEINGISVTAQADRIDLRKDGACDIIDFKTGGIPSLQDVQKGKKPQLGIEALILKQAGFKINSSEVNDLLFLELKGKEDGVNIRKIKIELEDFKKGLSELLTRFFSDDAKYFASNSLSWGYLSGEYKKLSRVEEWYDNQ